MKNPLNVIVSVIVPVYNTEEYVEETLRSIMNQTLDNLEIIVVNDGSTDGSLAVIERLAAEDARIQVYSQINSGTSVSRNKGINLSKGKYIYFMDSDDVLDNDALERSIARCESEVLDLICFDAEILNTQETYNLGLNYKRDTILQNDTLYTGLELFKILLKKKGHYSCSVCLYVVRTEYVKSIALSFYPNIIHEDQLFTAQLYLQSKRIGYIDEAFFKRRLRPGSIMTTRFSMKNMNAYFLVSDKLLLFAKTKPETQATIDLLLTNMLSDAVWLSYRLPLADRLKIAKVCLEKYRNYVTMKNLFIMLVKLFIKRA